MLCAPAAIRFCRARANTKHTRLEVDGRLDHLGELGKVVAQLRQRGEELLAQQQVLARAAVIQRRHRRGAAAGQTVRK